MEIMKELSKILKNEFPDIPSYFGVIEQNFKTPSFRFELVSHRDIGIVGIKFNRVYTVDIIYRGEKEIDGYSISEEVQKLISNELKSYVVLGYEVEFLDNDTHLIMNLMRINYQKVQEYNCNSFYGYLKDTIERISNKKCYLITCDLSEAEISKGIYLIRPGTVDIETISLNHRKQKERTIDLIYVEDSERHSMEILDEYENIMDKLIEDQELKRKIVNMDYGISVNYETEEEYFTDLIYFNTELIVKER